MKIAFVDSKLALESGGGLASQLDLQARGLVELGHEVSAIVLTTTPGEQLPCRPYRVIEERLNSSLLGLSLNVGLLRVLRRYESQTDVFYINRTWLSLGGALYRALGGKRPVVVNLNSFHFCANRANMTLECCMGCGVLRSFHCHRGNVAVKVSLLPLRAFKRRLERWLMGNVDAFVPVTEGMAEVYSRQHYDRARMTPIFPPIDCEYLSSLRKRGTGPEVSPSRFNILYVGRLGLEKGVDILVRAMSLLDFPAVLHIVGDGPERASLQRLAEELHLSDRVVFHGWVPHSEVFDFYLDAQLFVHPARWPEVFCLTVMEAMALGTAVVVSDYGGVASELGGAGLTFRRGDAHNLAEKIRLVHDDLSLASSLTAEALAMSKQFDYRALAAVHSRVFQEVVEGGR